MKQLLFCACFVFIVPNLWGQEKLNESFEGEKFPPSGWTVKCTAKQNNKKWTVSTHELNKFIPGYNKSGEKLALSQTGGLGLIEPVVEDSRLTTPQITIEEGDILNFMLGYNSSYNELKTYREGEENKNMTDAQRIKFEVIVSTSEQPTDETFTDTIFSFIPVGLAKWSNYSIDLSRFAGKNIYIQFHDYGKPVKGTFLGNSLCLDDIRINKTKTPDIELTGVSSPVSGCLSEQQVVAKVLCMSEDITDFNMCYQVDDNKIIRELVTTGLTKGVEKEYVFSAKAILQEGQKHLVKVWCDTSSGLPDLNNGNDTIIVQPEIRMSAEYPYSMNDENARQDFESSYSTNSGTAVYGWAWLEHIGWVYTYNKDIPSYLYSTKCLSLPKGIVRLRMKYTATMENCMMYAYLIKEETGNWGSPAGKSEKLKSVLQPTTIGFNIEIPEAGNYSIALTPANTNPNIANWQVGLFGLDIMDPYEDVRIESIESPFVNATLAKAGITVAAKFKNVGKSDLTDIPVAYQIGDQTSYGTIDNLKVNEETIYTFADPLDLSSTGDPKHYINYQLKVWADLKDMDEDHMNDTLTQNITAYEAKSFPYVTGFETEEDSLIWLSYNPDRDLVYWGTENVAYGGINYAKEGTHAAYINSFEGIKHNDYFISPAIRMKKAEAARLAFYFTTKYTTGNSHLKVYISTTDAPEQFKEKAELLLDLPVVSVKSYQYAYAPLNIKEDGIYYFAFYNDGGGRDILLDDVRIDNAMEVAMLGLSTTAVSGYDLNEAEITAKFANFGVSTLKDLELSFTTGITDGKEMIEKNTVTETYAKDIQPGDTVTYTFKTKADISQPGTYVFVANIKHEKDADNYNNQYACEGPTHYQTKHLPVVLDFEDANDRAALSLGRGWETGGGFNYGLAAAYEGSGAIRHNGQASDSGDWIFLNCMNIPEGEYTFSCFWRTSLNNEKDDMKQSFSIYLGKEPTPESMVSLLYEVNDTLNPSKLYTKVMTDVEITQSGNYYIGIKCTTRNILGHLLMDYFKIAKKITDGITLDKPYVADFENREEEWYHYYPSPAAFEQWTKKAEGDITYMSTQISSLDPWASRTFAGAYVAPAFRLQKGDSIKVSFGYEVASLKENATEEELGSIALKLCMAEKDMPDAFVIPVATGTISVAESQAEGRVTIPADGIYYFGYLTESRIPARFDLYSTQVEKLHTTGITARQTENKQSFYMDGNTLFIDSEYKRLDIYDITGKRIKTYSGIRPIDMDNLGKGVYLVSITTVDGIVTGKVTVK